MVIEHKSSTRGSTYVLWRDEITDEINDYHETDGLVKTPKGIKVHMCNILPKGYTPCEEANSHNENTQQKGKYILYVFY